MRYLFFNERCMRVRGKGFNLGAEPPSAISNIISIFYAMHRRVVMHFRSLEGTQEGKVFGCALSGPYVSIVFFELSSCIMSCRCTEKPVRINCKINDPFVTLVPQVLIQESGERRIVGVGVVYQGYNCHYMPGWIDGTVGYHADDGKIFEARCGDNLGREVAGNLMILFTVNGFPTFTMAFNRSISIHQYSNMASRLSGQTFIFGCVFFAFFVSRSLLGIKKQKELKKCLVSLGVIILRYRTWPILSSFWPPAF